MGKLYSRIAFWAFFMCACMLLHGCIDAVVGKVEPEEPPMNPVWFEGGRVRPGIALIVQVGSLASQPVTMQVFVDQNGDITLQHLLQSPVACDGLTLEALKQKLVKVYSEYYKQPQVSVTFAPYDGKGVSPWGTVTVLGEVNMPGPVNMPSTMNLTVTKVLQAAGGLKPFADKKKIRVSRRDRDGNVEKFTVDINEIGRNGRIDKDIPLHAGDVVWVPETWY